MLGASCLDIWMWGKLDVWVARTRVFASFPLGPFGRNTSLGLSCVLNSMVSTPGRYWFINVRGDRGGLACQLVFQAF